MNLLAKKHEEYYYSKRTFSHSWVYDKSNVFVSHCISTLFIWCCRVCYFAWWTRILWGHRATLVFIEMMGALEQLCLMAPKSLIWNWSYLWKTKCPWKIFKWSGNPGRIQIFWIRIGLGLKNFTVRSCPTVSTDGQWYWRFCWNAVVAFSLRVANIWCGMRYVSMIYQ